MRLSDLFTGGLTHRELISYIDGLPQYSSALGRSVMGESADWDPVMHRLTDLGDLLIEVVVAAAGGKPGNSQRLPRPRFATVAQEREHRAEMDARLEEIKARRAAKAAAQQDSDGG